MHTDDRVSGVNTKLMQWMVKETDAILLSVFQKQNLRKILTSGLTKIFP